MAQKEIRQQFRDEFKQINAEQVYNAYIAGDDDKLQQEMIAYRGDTDQLMELLDKLQQHFQDNNAATDEEWEFENVLPDDHFISQYLDFAEGITDAYSEYHFGSALTLLSMALDRKVRVEVSPTSMYPNMWTLCIGYSTVSRKSTALSIADTIIEMADLQQKKLPEEFSPEALIAALEDNPQSMFLKDEFGDFLAKMNRNYQKGVGALLSRLYGCPSHYKRKLRKEEIEIEDAYISMLGACVPRQLARYTSVDDLESGFFPRMAIIWPEREKERMDRRALTEEENKQQRMLGEWVSMVHQGVSQSAHMCEGGEIAARPTSEALDYYNGWCEDFERFIQETEKGKDFAAFFGRVSDMVLKVATLVELGSVEYLDMIRSISGVSSVSGLVNERMFTSSPSKDMKGTNLLSEGEVPVSLNSVKVATYYAVKLFLPNSYKLMKYVKAYHEGDQLERIHELAKRHADNETNTVKHSDLLRKANMNSKDFKETVHTLQEADKLKIMENNGATEYMPLEPDKAENTLPGIDKPVDISFSLPDDVDVDREQVETENGADVAVEDVLELYPRGDPVEYIELEIKADEELNLPATDFNRVHNKLLNEGRISEPRKGKYRRHGGD